MEPENGVDSLARHYDRISPLYDLFDWPYERFRYRKLRPVLCSDLSGKVLEAGVGTGRNLDYYSERARVTAIDTSVSQLSRAKKRTEGARCEVELLQMDVTRMEFDDSQFDACVSTFLFCVLPDHLQLSALREILRVVRPGGTVRLLEYVFSQKPLRRFFMKALAPYVELVFRARFDRATEDAVHSSGAEVVVERFVYQDTIKMFELKRPLAS